MIGSPVVHTATGRIGDIVKVQSRKEGGRVVVKWRECTASDVEGQRLIASGEQTQHTFSRSDIRAIGAVEVDVSDDDEAPTEAPSDAPVAPKAKKKARK